MRIITGIYRGRILKSVPDNSVRPATDRVKGTIYNMLQNRLRVEDCMVLDLFAGSGSLGFEAISRGASHCVFVDSDLAALDVIEKNAEALDCLSSCEIIHDDALSFIGRAKGQFDLVFADPPYAYSATAELPLRLFEHDLVCREGYLIIEHHKRTVIPGNDLYSLEVEKQFGSTRVSFFTHPKPEKEHK